MKKLKEIDFNEALDRIRKDERVYAVDLTTDKITTKLASRLEVGDMLRNNYTFLVMEEIDK